MNVASRVKLATNLAVIGGVAALVISPLDILSGALKLGWRLVKYAFIALIFVKLLGMLVQFGFRVMMAGGPIRALKGALFGGVSDACGSLASFCSGRGVLDRLADFFDGVASACDDRMPPPTAFGGGGGSPFGGGGSPFGGGGSPFGGGGSPFGGGGSPFGGGASPFGGGASPFGGDASPFDELLKGTDPSAFGTGFSTGAPASPFTPSTSGGGVTITVRARGSGPTPPSPGSGAGAGNPPPDAAGEVIDVEGKGD